MVSSKTRMYSFNPIRYYSNKKNAHSGRCSHMKKARSLKICLLQVVTSYRIFITTAKVPTRVRQNKSSIS